MRKKQLITLMFGFYPLTLVRLPLSKLKVSIQLLIVAILVGIALWILYHFNVLNLITGFTALSLIVVPYGVGYYLMDDTLM